MGIAVAAASAAAAAATQPNFASCHSQKHECAAPWRLCVHSGTTRLTPRPRPRFSFTQLEQTMSVWWTAGTTRYFERFASSARAVQYTHVNL